jgi:hypothetical protein
MSLLSMYIWIQSTSRVVPRCCKKIVVGRRGRVSRVAISGLDNVVPMRLSGRKDPHKIEQNVLHSHSKFGDAARIGILNLAMVAFVLVMRRKSSLLEFIFSK